MMGESNITTQVNDSNFEQEVLKGDIPVLVDFWAEWCGPCKMIAPVVEEVATEYAGKLKVCKINVDDASQIASQYGIMSIPTLVIFKNGEVVDKLTGAVPKANIIQRIEMNIT
jgi:thioredoxin 1